MADSIHARFADRARMDAALAKAVREALRQHKQAGHSVAVWQDEKVVILRPEEIPGTEDALEAASSLNPPSQGKE